MENSTEQWPAILAFGTRSERNQLRTKLVCCQSCWCVLPPVSLQDTYSDIEIVTPGVCIGLNAAIISIVTAWLSDIKMGYCSDGWWLNQQFCCWEVEGDEVDGCESWKPWTTVSLGRWIIFIGFAVSLQTNSPDVTP